MTTKKVIWAHSLVQGKISGFRKSYNSIFDVNEFPVNRFGISTDYINESGIASIVPEPEYHLENLTNDWKSRYFDTVDAVAENLIKTANGRKISVYYSGGIDSTVVVVSLLRHKDFNSLNESDLLEIRLTTSSINEYPSFFYNHILPKFKHIAVADPQDTMNDSDAIMVTGDMGDYIIGSSDVLAFIPNDDLDLSLSSSFLLDQIKLTDVAGHYYNVIVDSMDQCPFKIESCLQLAWWQSQCFAYQDELVRPYIWSDAEPIDVWKQDKVFKFFYDSELTRFSYEYMSTNPVFKTFKETRTLPKEYIFNYTNDRSYLESKSKTPSQRHILRHIRKTVVYDGGSYLFDPNQRINLT